MKGAYEYGQPYRSTMRSVEKLDGETIEQKVERLQATKEPIKDGAPEIYTERSQGVISAYNIRTDRWEIAAEAMDKVQMSIVAKRDAKAKETDDKSKVINLGEKGTAEPSQDTGN